MRQIKTLFRIHWRIHPVRCHVFNSRIHVHAEDAWIALNRVRFFSDMYQYMNVEQDWNNWILCTEKNEEVHSFLTPSGLAKMAGHMGTLDSRNFAWHTQLVWGVLLDVRDSPGAHLENLGVMDFR